MNKETTTTAKPNPAPRTPMFIVAEVSKNWPEDKDALEGRLAQRFEAILNVNLERGYTLKDWKLETTVVPLQSGMVGINETIIAIFQLTHTVVG